jgi:IS605 OrfB family transposase
VGPDRRARVDLCIPKFQQSIFDSWKFRSATLKYRKGKFWLNLVYFKPDPEPVLGDVLGVDRGLHNLVTCSDGANFKNNKARAIQRKHLFNRRKLQKKGTPSAIRRLKKMSGREKRFIREQNHVITSKLASMPYNVLVLEDLKGVSKNKRKGKRLNKHLSSWPFYQLQTFLEYKAEAYGKKVEYVDARYTSQICSSCGDRTSGNRCAGKYRCRVCGYNGYADLNAAINIKHIFLRNLERKQGAVNHPNVQKSCTSRPACLGGS